MTPISAALKAERSRRGWNQRRCAQLLGVSQPTYQKWEAGKDDPGGEWYPGIITFLGLDVKAAADLALRQKLAVANISLAVIEEWRGRAEKEPK